MWPQATDTKILFIMLRRSLLSLVALLCFAFVADAQIARWGVTPSYEKISLNNVGMFVVEKNRKQGLYSRNFEEVIPVAYDEITPFNNGCALLFNDRIFAGFVTEDGFVVNASDLSGSHEFKPIGTFNSGRLLLSYTTAVNVPAGKGSKGAVTKSEITHHRFVDRRGVKVGEHYPEAYPFHDGYAVVKKAIDPKYPEELIYAVIDVDGAEAAFSEDLNMEHVTFLSSFTDGVAIAIIKNKFYHITAEYMAHELMYLNNEVSRKNIISFDPDVENAMSWTSDGDFRIVTKSGGWLLFDKNMVLKEMSLGGDDSASMVAAGEEAEVQNESSIKSYYDGYMYGLMYKGANLLPPQFEDISGIGEDFVVAKKNGLYGILEVDTKNSFVLSLNHDRSVGFQHRDKDVVLQVSMPRYIDCASTIVACCTPGCKMDLSSRTETSNIHGNFINYNGCYLSLPEGISKSSKPFKYSFQLEYEGLVTEPFELSINAWLDAYYSISLRDTVFTLTAAEDPIDVCFSVATEKDANNYTYQKDIVVYVAGADGALSEVALDEIGNDEYRFTYLKGEADAVNFFVYITEEGCPTISCPYVLNYTIPEPIIDEATGEPLPQNTIARISNVGKQQIVPEAPQTEAAPANE